MGWDAHVAKLLETDTPKCDCSGHLCLQPRSCFFLLNAVASSLKCWTSVPGSGPSYRDLGLALVNAPPRGSWMLSFRFSGKFGVYPHVPPGRRGRPRHWMPFHVSGRCSGVRPLCTPCAQLFACSRESFLRMMSIEPSGMRPREETIFKIRQCIEVAAREQLIWTVHAGLSLQPIGGSSGGYTVGWTRLWFNWQLLIRRVWQ